MATLELDECLTQYLAAIQRLHNLSKADAVDKKAIQAAVAEYKAARLDWTMASESAVSKKRL